MWDNAGANRLRAVATAISAVALSVSAGVEAQGPKRPLFGDLHVHTNVSSDAYVFQAPTSLDQAYAFAAGAPLTLPGDRRVQLAAPLDFVAVVDHADWLGEMGTITTPGAPGHDHPFAQRARRSHEGKITPFNKVFKEIMAAEEAKRRVPLTSEENRVAMASRVWREVRAAADRNYRPGKLTTFAGFEWTFMPQNDNLHRQVILRGDHEAPIPPSLFDSSSVEDLWAWMDRAGGPDHVLAIPHNSNLSNGRMFAPTLDGRPYDAALAARRRTYEPVVEIAQVKGTSESHPLHAPADPDLQFELMPLGMTWNPGSLGAKSPYSWAREGLKQGLLIEQRTGENPYRFGFVGSTDTHLGNAGFTAEATTIGYLGNFSDEERLLDLETNSAGALTGVWAEENSRDAIWVALRRRETFATSGTRIKVRFFASFNLDSRRMFSPAWLRRASLRAQPMGGVLSGRPGRALSFAVEAEQAIDGAELDRVQIVKGWAEGGKAFESVTDIACSAGRRPVGGRCASLRALSPGQCGKVAPGSKRIATAWTDKKFNPAQSAFYYVRVLEVPTCRWTSLLAERLGKTPPVGSTYRFQERAWTSPIWYDPKPRSER